MESAGLVPLICDVCNKTFSGLVPATQHFESQAHKKKIEISRSLNTRGIPNKFNCDVCNIWCDTAIILEKHKNSPRHMAMVEKAAQFRSASDAAYLNLNQNAIPIGATGYQNNNAAQNWRTIEKEPHVVYKHRNEKSVKDYEFDGSRGYCHICQVDLSSYNQAKQHLNGTKHQRAAQRKEMGLPNVTEQLNCNACGVVFSGPESAVQHFAGEKHKKRSQQIIENSISASQSTYISQDTVGVESSYMPTENLVCLDNCVGGQVGKKVGISNTGHLNLEPGPHPRQSLPPKAAAAATPRVKFGVGATQKEYVFDGSEGYCFVCSVNLTSNALANQHLLGQKHKKAAVIFHQTLSAAASALPNQDWIPLSPDARQHTPPIETRSMAKEHNLYPLSCDICRTIFNGQATAAQHFASEKHNEKEAVKNAISKNSTRMVLDDESLTYTTEGTVTWYNCKICSIRVNSLEQLNTHKQSQKHRKLSEKRDMSENPLMVDVQHSDNLQRIKNVQPRFTPPKQELRPKGFNDLAEELSSFIGTFTSVPVSDQFIDIPSNPSPSVEFNLKALETTPFSKIQDVESTELDTSLNMKSIDDSLDSGISFPVEDTKHVGCFTGFSDPPSLDVNSFDKDTESFDETRVKTLYSLPSQPDSGYRPDESLNERICDKDEPFKPAIKFDACKGIEPNADPCQVRSILSSNFGMGNGGMKLSQRSLPLMPKAQQDSIISNTDVIKDVDDSMGFRRSGKSPRKMIDPEVTTDLPLPVMSKYATLQSESEVNGQEMRTNSGRKRTAGSDIARALKNRTQQVKSLGLGAESSSIEQSKHPISTRHDESLGNLLETLEKMSVSNEKTPQKEESSTDNFHSSGMNSTSGRLHAEFCSNMNANGVKSPFKYHDYYCSTCNRPMNTEKSWREHVQGRSHLQKVSEEKALNRRHQPLVRELLNYGDRAFELTQTVPREYQRELFSKAMERDTICFLPTGTGKTLVSCMVISAMLEHNPSHQVLFLVDKVLLVLQQAKYIKKELGDRIYRRFNRADPSKTEDRKLNIAMLCGGQQTTGGVPLWKHDIVVITAAFCENLISKEIIRWEDQCLLVFDEAHHCVKNHPFNRLLEELQQKRLLSLPKILGLTASPAGKDTLQLTVEMIGSLRHNMGGAKLAVVNDHQKELKIYQSNAQISVNFQPMTKKEASFKETLELYLLQCYLRLAADTDINQQFGINVAAERKSDLSEDDMKAVAQNIVNDVLSLQEAIVMARPKDNTSTGRQRVEGLKQHTQNICMVLNVMVESGVSTAIEELQELSAGRVFSNFEFAEDVGLECQDLIHQLEMCLNIKRGQPEENVSLRESSSQFYNLVHELTSGEHIDWRKSEAMALVLVKQRCTAKSIYRQLMTNPSIMEKELRVTWVVGHGSGSDEQGMSVAQQKRVLEEIKAHYYHVVIATSVAEEGIDLPECELVISLNPPSTVTALVQMRGRARKKNSKFVVLCTNESEKEKLSDLMLREDNMIKACYFTLLKSN